jgi:hypothetical protein
MNPILAAGLMIGVFCGLWTFVMGFTGWYRDPVMNRAFYTVVAIEVIALAWGLRQTARQGRGWAGQVVAGALMAVVGGVIVMMASLLFTTVAFPDFFAEAERLGVQQLRQAGVTEDQIAAQVARTRSTATPMNYALMALVATFITGTIASAALAVVIRERVTSPFEGSA